MVKVFNISDLERFRSNGNKGAIRMIEEIDPSVLILIHLKQLILSLLDVLLDFNVVIQKQLIDIDYDILVLDF